MEYNKQYFKKIKIILKKNKSYFYDLKNNKMNFLSSKIDQNIISRTTKKNFLSIRNIYFVHKEKKLV